MKVSYNKDADAMYIELKKGKFAKNNKLDDFTILDLDSDDAIIGIELLDVSKRMPEESFSEVHVKNMIAIEE